MIVVQLIGGLGNQLFQYAAARRLSYTRNTKLKLDISDFAGYHLHAYALSHFRIKQELADNNDLKQFVSLSPFIPSRFARYFLKRRLLVENVFCEKGLIFDENLLNASGHAYLTGYWQNEKYFSDISWLLKKEFTVQESPNTYTRAMLKRIKSAKNSVSVHVRRGDYATDLDTQQVHGLLGTDYYRPAAFYMIKHLISPTFFIFSDDIVWAKKNLKFLSPSVYVDGNGPARNYDDLRLMQTCSHAVIANSTFSWWAAWLMENKSKIVIAPQNWFCDPSLNSQYILPENWIRL